MPDIPTIEGQLKEAREENLRLLNAIREHFDQSGDDKCWLDDQKLYAAVGLRKVDLSLPPKEEFLGNCERYWKCRQEPGSKYRTWPQAKIWFERGVLAMRETAASRILSDLSDTVSNWPEGETLLMSISNMVMLVDGPVPDPIDIAQSEILISKKPSV